MSEFAENIPTPQYPTREDVTEYQRRVENLSTGANIHKLATCVAIMGQIVKLANRNGWNADELKKYNDEKLKLNELFVGIQ